MDFLLDLCDLNLGTEMEEILGLKGKVLYLDCREKVVKVRNLNP